MSSIPDVNDTVARLASFVLVLMTLSLFAPSLRAIPADQSVDAPDLPMRRSRSPSHRPLFFSRIPVARKPQSAPLPTFYRPRRPKAPEK